MSISKTVTNFVVGNSTQHSKKYNNIGVIDYNIHIDNYCSLHPLEYLNFSNFLDKDARFAFKWYTPEDNNVDFVASDILL